MWEILRLTERGLPGVNRGLILIVIEIRVAFPFNNILFLHEGNMVVLVSCYE